MGKKGYNPHEKQSSTMANGQALKLLLSEEYGFAVARNSSPPPISEIKTAFRKDVLSARRAFGDNAMISITGRSITLTGAHIETGEYVHDLHIKLSGMLGIGEKQALYELTGIPEFAPAQK